MRSQQKWMWLLIAAGVFLLACGFGGQVAEQLEGVNATVESASQEMETVVETAAAEAGQAGATAAAAGQEMAATAAAQATTMAETVQEEAAADEAASEPEAEEAPATGSEPMGELSSLDSTNLQNTLNTFDSYAMTYRIDFDSDEESGGMVMNVEATNDPQRLHVVMQATGDSATQMGAGEVQIYVAADEVGGPATMYMQNPEDQSWFAVTAGSINEAYGNILVSPDDFADLPPEAEFINQETINGILTEHYRFNETSFPAAEVGSGTIQGEAWLAVDGGYLVKFTLRAEGTSALGEEEVGLPENAAYDISYELLKVNDASISIEVPEEAQAAESFTIPGSSANPDDIDLPMTDDASVEFAMTGLLNYTSAMDTTAIWEFYQSALPEAGWTLVPDTQFEMEGNVMAQFEKDGSSLQLMISAEEGTTRVILSSE